MNALFNVIIIVVLLRLARDHDRINLFHPLKGHCLVLEILQLI